MMMILLASGCSAAPGAPWPAAADASQTIPTVIDAAADGSEPPAYDAAAFTGTDIWVDPATGDDANDGLDRSRALRTLDAAWRRIPAGVTLEVGYRLRLAAGVYPPETTPNYWEDRKGTAAAPIIIEAADGAHSARLEGGVNMYGVSYLSLVGVDIFADGDAFHCERCDHLLIKEAELSGGSAAQETVKVNQSQYVYIEDSDIHGAQDNAIDFVAVQYGRVTGSRIHDAQDWCMYVKGGSAYLNVSGNEVFNCGTGGITAGQGTGFEFMVAPWLNYEAYGIQIVNNVIHDTEGAGLGVAGGFNILLAYNTLYSVGIRSHLVEFVRGRRGCDGAFDVCASQRDAGGWGTTGGEEPWIPNRHVYFYNNVILNPANVRSRWQQFQFDGPLETSVDSGIPSPSLADDDLRIVGNVIWNGPPELDLGTGDGCPPSNTSCNETQLGAANSINTVEVSLNDPLRGDYSLTAATRAALPPAVAVPDFVWDATPLDVPQDATTDVSTDRAGRPRAEGGPPGAE